MRGRTDPCEAPAIPADAGRRRGEMKNISLITGGARSGKSGFALTLAERYPNKAFIAMAEPFDEEMRQRIARHREEPKKDFLLFESPLQLVKSAT